MTAAEKTPLWKRLLPTLLGLAVLVFLFGFVLPQYIDYDAVFRAIGEIDAWEWLILIVLSIVRFVPEGWVYQAAQPGLRMWQGTQLFLVGETLANVPPGGLDIVGRYQMARSWGYESSESTSATIASWVFSNASKLILPVVASLWMAVNRIRSDDLDALALIAIAVFVVGGIAIIALLRSESFVDRVSLVVERIVGLVTRVFRKQVTTDFRDVLRQFRTAAAAVLRQRSLQGIGVGLAARAMSFLVMLVAVRFVGIDASAVPTPWVFAAFSIVMAMTVIPIFSMPGLTEIVLVFVLGQVAGRELADQVAAAVFVYRALTWLAPIPFGAWLFSRWWNGARHEIDGDLLSTFSSPTR